MARTVILLLAEVFDGVDEQGGRFFSPARRRVLDVGERARVLEYLVGAPLVVSSSARSLDEVVPSRGVVVPAGYRSDGGWLWSEAVAYYLREYGVAPERGLLAAIEGNGYTPPLEVAPDVPAFAARVVAGETRPRLRVPPRRDLGYFAWVGPGSTVDDPAGLLRRWVRDWPHRGDITVVEAVGYDLRWHVSGLLREGSLPGRVVPVSGRQAAAVLDRWLAVGGVGVGGVGPARFAVAAVFDAVDGSGRPCFSPDRRRVLEPVERRRLLGYLSGAPLVLRAHGLEPDPLDAAGEPVVPVGYRTDGVWVWQEAVEYYLRRYGVAPEDDLVAHIERCGYRPPGGLSDVVLNAAADAALLPGADPPGGRRPARYFTYAERSGQRHALFRQWSDDDGYRVDEVSMRDMYWRHTGAFVQNARSGEEDFVEISALEAVEILNDRWNRWAQEPAAQ